MVGAAVVEITSDLREWAAKTQTGVEDGMRRIGAVIDEQSTEISRTLASARPGESFGAYAAAHQSCNRAKK